ncbi:unnamed protein product [Vitrella brassicaformis CCMP3155]|uniref:Uncharacterized protein n=1 Tax=Vitrella brassicaformis (strain CCMP3155) TaxID=1169540 RepID=A0A0G4FSF3_VITBC|nr:unnamed protein product [Vitrella brassicaformis CCMP3155]|eukprot:CEM17620.1 unnamed protein product [Vitrella brassicaformis CCMP3155]
MRDQSAPLWSREGTTQGDPLASLFYSVATLPLVWEMKRPAEEGPQAWFADDSAKVGDLQPVRDWWDELQRRGPLRGYHPNGKKSKLVVRAGCEERAQEVFGDTDVEILVQEAERNNAFLATRPVGKDDANEATLRQFRRLIDKGKVRQAVRLLTEREGGGALDPNDLAEADPAGRTVREVLESKHPAQSDPDPSCFLDRPLPPLTQVEITANHIERAARATKGGAGPVGGESSV